MQGWGKDGKYEKLIKWTSLEHFKGIAVGMKEITPLPGMSPGLALLVRESDFDTIVVHIGPKWFVGSVGIKEGDRVNLRGVWAKINDEWVLIGSKFKLGDITVLKVRRNRDGTPFWTMSQDELAMEMDAQRATGLKGWEKEGAYEKQIKWKPPEDFKGIIVGAKEIRPLEGMAPGLALLIRESNFDTITVHVGPKWFIGDLGVKEGEKVSLRGVWTNINGEDVLIASKIKKGDYFEFKVRRTSDGLPYWDASQNK